MLFTWGFYTLYFICKVYIVFTDEHVYIFLLTKINHHCFEDRQLPLGKRNSTSRDSPLPFFFLISFLTYVYIPNELYLFLCVYYHFNK